MQTFRELYNEIGRLSSRIEDALQRTEGAWREVEAELRPSAKNLVAYLALRGLDLRRLQFELERHGLSSLGRMEGHVRESIHQVTLRLRDAVCSDGDATELQGVTVESDNRVTADQSEQILHRHTQALLGPRPSDRHTYVMVTAPSADEVDSDWAARLLDAGMNLLRVNAAHGDEREWLEVIRTVRGVAESKAVPLRVIVDLPGPKLRTVALDTDLHVARWKPRRDELGRVTEPCSVTLREQGESSPAGAPATLSLPASLLSELMDGDELAFRDARNRKRRLTVAELSGGRRIAYLRRTAYVIPGIMMELRRGHRHIGSFEVRDVPKRAPRWLLKVGDRLRLQRAVADSAALSDRMPCVGCSLPEALARLLPGQRVIFDDGKIECSAEQRTPEGVILKVLRAAPGGTNLKPEKGINLPDTDLSGLEVGPDDERALAFALEHADLVGVSFVREPANVRAIQERIGSRPNFGIVLKIETATAFANLPAILLTAMARYPVGVMIARGDLAIEVGFERLAEVQEEILWLCEAAHLPVIWATEVLAQLAQEGLATRAEVTDAAMSVRAECVMLNKGPRIEVAVKTLVNILQRMEHHQYKKRTLYRKLSLTLPLLHELR